MLWIELKIRKFSVKTLYLALELACLVFVLTSCIWNSWGPIKVVFCMEGDVRKGLTLDYVKRRGWSLVNKCFLATKKRNSLITSSVSV